MPARLGQVSSLLAGSSLEEELMALTSDPPTAVSPRGDSPGPSSNTDALAANSSALHGALSGTQTLAPSTDWTLWTRRKIVLTSDPHVISRAVAIPRRTSEQHHPTASGPLPPVCVSSHAVKRQKTIETPDFRPRDDSLYMPKTRGLRSTSATHARGGAAAATMAMMAQDLSDTAYARAHRKGETSEKRQRKAEVDHLARDRAKVVHRIEQLRAVEARMLQPILVARSQARRSAHPEPSAKGTAKSTHEELEEIRSQLLTEARDTLRRYDFLLSSSTHVLPSVEPASPADRREGRPASNNGVSSRSQSPRITVTLKRRPTTSAAATSKKLARRHHDTHTSGSDSANSDRGTQNVVAASTASRRGLQRAAAAHRTYRTTHLSSDDDDDDESTAYPRRARYAGENASNRTLRSSSISSISDPTDASSSSSSSEDDDGGGGSVVSHASRASSLGHAYPTLPPTHSLKVSPSLVELATNATAAPSSPLPPPTSPSATAPVAGAASTQRRATRRTTLQAFGEKLPDILTKSSPFDYAIITYLQHIDRPYVSPK